MIFNKKSWQSFTKNNPLPCATSVTKQKLMAVIYKKNVHDIIAFTKFYACPSVPINDSISGRH